MHNTLLFAISKKLRTCTEKGMRKARLDLVTNDCNWQVIKLIATKGVQALISLSLFYGFDQVFETRA